MMRWIAVSACLAMTLSAQHVFDNALNVTFPNGMLRVQTESARPPKGVVALDEGGVSHRIVNDQRGNVLFAYDLSLTPEGAGLFTIRATPSAKSPTIAAPQAFPRVGLGEKVKLEVLSDPETGERLFDVLQPVTPPAPRRPPDPDLELSLENIHLSVNGALVAELRNQWMIGVAVKIGLPRIGTVYLARTPRADWERAEVNGKRLSFAVGPDRVEIVSESNLLKLRETGAVWFHLDPAGRDARTVSVEVMP